MTHPALRPSPSTETQPSGPASFEPLSVDTDDWVILFRAVIARLERIAALSPDGTPTLDVPDPAVDLRVAVRDCAGALRQLHTMFVHDAGRQRPHLILDLDGQIADLRRSGIETSAPMNDDPKANVRSRPQCDLS